MPATVNALLPLSFLEAVRRVDAPDDDLDAELVLDLRNKRFGLSDTVYAQIQRYTEATRRDQRTVHEEAAGIARLLGRRPDAEAVFCAAGRYLAAEAHAAIPTPTRRLIAALPALLARPIALRQLRATARRFLDGSVRRVGAFVTLEVTRPVTRDSAPRHAGCAFYEAAFRELLRRLAVSGGAVEHVRCAERGDELCEWRAEWRAIAHDPAPRS